MALFFLIPAFIRNKLEALKWRKAYARHEESAPIQPKYRYFPNECGTYQKTSWWNLEDNNAIYCVEFEMTLTYRDWCEFQNTNVNERQGWY